LLCAIQSLLFIQKKFIELFDTGNYNEKETSKYRARTSSFHFRGLLMLRCRSPPFFCLKTSRQKENGELEMKKEYYLYVDGHFSETIVDEAIDVENIVETKIMIEAVKNAISMFLPITCLIGLDDLYSLQI